MKISYCFLTFLFSIHLAVFSQNTYNSPVGKIQWGKSFKSLRKVNKIIGTDGTNYYTLDDRKINKLDNNLSITISNRIDFQAEKKYRHFSFEDIILTKKKIYLFTSFYDLKTKQIIINKHICDKESLMIDENVDPIGSFTGIKSQVKEGFSIIASPDSSKFLFYKNLSTEKKLDNEQFYAIVLNASFEKLWDKEISIPYSSKLFDIESFNLDNQGNIHILGINFFEKIKDKVNGLPNYAYHILSYSEKGSKEQEYKVTFKDKFITDMNIAINPFGNIIGVGLYSEKGTSSIRGSFYIKINTISKKIVIEKICPFENNILEKYIKPKKLLKGKNEILNYALDHIHIHTNGSISFTAEQYYQTEETYSQINPNGGVITYTSTKYHFNDILIFHHSLSGELEWTSVLKKRQRTSDDYGFYSSYSLAVKDNELYIIFNDNSKNHLLDKGTREYTYTRSKKTSCISVAVVSPKGKINYYQLFDGKEVDIYTAPSACKQLKNNEMLLMGFRSKRGRFVKWNIKSPKEKSNF